MEDMNEKQIIEIRDKFLFFDNHKKIMNIMGYEYDETISHNKNCVNFFVIMRDNNRLNELSGVIDKELGLTPKDFNRTIECSFECNDTERIPTMTTPKDIEERMKDKACKVFGEMLVELCPELLGYGAMAVEWENEFRKRLEK
jgi:hypothetical protein